MGANEKLAQQDEKSLLSDFEVLDRETTSLESLVKQEERVSVIKQIVSGAKLLEPVLGIDYEILFPQLLQFFLAGFEVLKGKTTLLEFIAEPVEIAFVSRLLKILKISPGFGFASLSPPLLQFFLAGSNVLKGEANNLEFSAYVFNSEQVPF